MSQPTSPTTATATELDERCINTIRFLAADAVQEANSGHPGMPMGMAPAAYVLWTRYLKHNPKDPAWINRDRFVLSAGHGSMLLYALLHLTGYDLPMDELKRFRQWGSKTPGHPEVHLTPGVETTTGPLGQGFANGIGMAIAERYLAAHLNTPEAPVIDHYTYAIVSDGDLMEGISQEAASLAGHLGLGKVIYLYDDNHISIDGSTDLAFTEDVLARFQAYGWHTQRVADGNDLAAIDTAIAAAQAVPDKPSLIAVRTVIGFGSPNKQGSASAHGEPLGEEELALAKKHLGWPADRKFYVPEEVYAIFRQAVEQGAAAQRAWDGLVQKLESADPDRAARLRDWFAGTLPEGWEDRLPTFEAGSKLATRAASGKVLNAIGPLMDQLIGGSADLTPSNKTDIQGRKDFSRDTPGGGYLRFGVREHAMAGICNGIALHGGLRPYCGTFLIFSDYMRPSVRLSALSEIPVIYVYTHDSIGLGEDGPTHQPVEHLMALRAIPNLTVIRPADANETVEAWRVALKHTGGPVALALTRQGLKTVDRSRYGAASGVQKGAYVLRDTEGTPDAIILATGSEVEPALAAAESLADEGVQVRVVSMPSWELFDAQPEAYRREVLPPEVRARVAVEAGVTMGWQKYVGLEGRIVGLDRFGASAPYQKLMEVFGFTAEHIADEVRALLKA
ncbi:transketolase [Rhodothermaceae bacterium RA]|nr:transketolase [Rhodothermaceae bacterium RA]